MRLILLAGSLAFLVCSAASAQTCEVMTIKNAADQIVSNNVMCVDESGAWVDPATAHLTPDVTQYPRAEVEVSSNLLAESPPVQLLAPQPVTVQPMPVQPILVQPVPVPPLPTQTVGYIPQPVAKPLPLAPVVYSDPIVEPPTLLSTPQPVLSRAQVLPAVTALQASPLPTPQGWQPTSGKAKRTALYAKLGLVCKARKAKFCGDVACTGLCEGKRGWCDGKTGEVHASLEAIERLYCRKKRK